MPIKHVLVALTGEVQSTSVPSCAFDLAQRFAAHVTGVDTIRNEPMYPHTAFSAVTSAYHVELAKTYDAMKRQQRDTARAAFEKARTHCGVTLAETSTGEKGASASWFDRSSLDDDPIVSLGRLADLIVLEQPEKRESIAHFNVIESAVFAARRPTLLLAQNHSELGLRGAIAWNGSAEAADAVERALPLLANLKEVDIIQVGEIRPEGIQVTSLINYLGWHELDARVHEVTDKPKSTAKLILQEAENIKSDFLIMGAYSRSPLRETVFGGVTQHMIKNAALPVLLVH